GTDDEPGVTPRAVREVFSYIQEDTTGREFLLRVSYMEIYNEKIKDLIQPENCNPEIIEDRKGVHVRNLKEVKVKTPEEVMDLIKLGEKNRHVSATDYNEHSSRSHSIFQITIESKYRAATEEVRISQLNLIDLAGSEKMTTDIERRKEGGYINKSLLTLGNVISKLTSNIPSAHIPFRDSKLTRILQAALSGNARIAVICTINPTWASKDESLNTLRFAQKAKLVRTAAKMTKLEAETHERLKNLLSLILTSTKDEDQKGMLQNLSNDELNKDSTMRDVVVRCEEGFTAQIKSYQQQIEKLRFELESTRDMNKVIETVQKQQGEKLTKRDVQIEHL
ncbi:P-loop containing nucleoside triphosphate hydrolase protein, partial [Backusella circina FSU 941]